MFGRAFRGETEEKTSRISLTIQGCTSKAEHVSAVTEKVFANLVSRLFPFLGSSQEELDAFYKFYLSSQRAASGNLRGLS